ncbi:MAG TPA: glycosyltransferase family 39 protein [Pyrinomonadaceae bacterium]|nr:glycosyltransferase family 39 protein [Pyrinomonadaceae bacterium]
MREEESKTPGRADARGFFGRRRAELLCALLLTISALTMLDVVRRKSLTTDELVMIPAGYFHVTTGDFRPVGEHPPFIKTLSALPLLFTGTEAPPIDPAPQPDYGYFLGLFNEFWQMNHGRYEAVTFWSRVPPVAITVLLGALVFLYGRRHFGERAALFAVALFSLEPTVLAHGRVVQTDVPSALAFFLFVFLLYDYLRKPALGRAVAVGLVAGLATVTKFSMVVLGPVIAVAFVALLALAPRLRVKRAQVAGQAAALAIAAVFAVNAAYFFQRGRPEPFEASVARSILPETLTGGPLRGALEVGYDALQVVFPADYVYGIGWQIGHARLGHAAGLLGQYSYHGWWYYYPVAFALKTPLPIILLSLAGLGWALWRLARAADRRMLLLVLPVAFFVALLAANSINIGVRYFLPAYPFLFVAAGAFLDWLLRRAGARRSMAAAAAVVALFAWVGIEAARAHPDHMSYVNQLASGRPHYWYLSDSNVEWGDDVKPLALYLRERGETRVGGAMLSAQVLERYGIEQTEIFVPPGVEPRPVRYVAIGASLLNGSTVPGAFADGTGLTEKQRVNYFADFRRRTPEKVFGGSIYLFRLRE